MNISSSKRILLQSLLVVGAALCAAPLRADIKLASPFTSHMVLQRDMSLPVWGLAEAGEDVTVVFAGQKQTVQADKDGNWRVNLQPVAVSSVGQPLTVSGSKSSQPVTLDDVLVGEVWLASGQSNMEFPVQASGPYRGVLNEEGEIAAANYPLIRMFTGKGPKTYEPQAEVTGDWLVCSPDDRPRLFRRRLSFRARSAAGTQRPRRHHRRSAGRRQQRRGVDLPRSHGRRSEAQADARSLDASVDYFRQKPPSRRGQRPHPPDADQQAARPPARSPACAIRRRTSTSPTVLFNGMINPVIPYAIAGAIWYQGESIVGGTPGLNLYRHVQEA